MAVMAAHWLCCGRARLQREGARDRETRKERERRGLERNLANIALLGRLHQRCLSSLLTRCPVTELSTLYCNSPFLHDVSSASSMTQETSLPKLVSKLRGALTPNERVKNWWMWWVLPSKHHNRSLPTTLSYFIHHGTNGEALSCRTKRRRFIKVQRWTIL